MSAAVCVYLREWMGCSENCAELRSRIARRIAPRGGAPAVLDVELHLLAHLHDALEALEHAEGQGVGGAQRVALHVEERLDHERRPQLAREELAAQPHAAQVPDDLEQAEQEVGDDDDEAPLAVDNDFGDDDDEDDATPARRTRRENADVPRHAVDELLKLESNAGSITEGALRKLGRFAGRTAGSRAAPADEEKAPDAGPAAGAQGLGLAAGAASLTAV